MIVFLEFEKPPTATSQMKKVAVINGKPRFYEPKAVKEARNDFVSKLSQFKPYKPIEGAVSLYVLWLFPKGKTHKDGEWKITRPDTDNMEKLLKDCMTDVGFWKDDAQVCQEIVEKRWSKGPCGIFMVIDSLEEVANDNKRIPQ